MYKDGADVMLPFIKKQDDRLPDCWGIKVLYLDGTSEEFEGIHRPPTEKGLFEITTHKDDIHHWIPMSSVKRVEFDRRFSKAYEIMRTKAEMEGGIKKVS